jgi:hypothetical protein
MHIFFSVICGVVAGWVVTLLLAFLGLLFSWPVEWIPYVVLTGVVVAVLFMILAFIEVHTGLWG